MAPHFCLLRQLILAVIIFNLIRTGLSQKEIEKEKGKDGCSIRKICMNLSDKLGTFISIEYLDKNLFEFTISGKTKGYIALGFSRDAQMGDDGVFACVYNTEKDSVDVTISKNDGDHENDPLTKSEIEVNKSQLERTDGTILCKFQTKARLNFGIAKFDLEKEKVFLLIAEGPSKSSDLEKHLVQMASGKAVNLTLYGPRNQNESEVTTDNSTTAVEAVIAAVPIEAESTTTKTASETDSTAQSTIMDTNSSDNEMSTLSSMESSEYMSTRVNASDAIPIKKKTKDKTWMKLHAVFMIIAWIIFLPIGAMVSRFFKETWTDIHIFGRRFWFCLHVVCMITAFVFAIFGCIFIQINRGYVFLPSPNKKSFAHCIMGLVAVFLMTINITSFWIPFKSKIQKNIQFIFHFAFGIGSFYIGVVNIALTPTWLGKKSILPCYTPYTILIWWIIHLAIYLLISSLITINDHSNAKGWIDYDGWRALSVPMRMVYSGEAPKSTLRKAILLLYILVSLIIAIFLMASVKDRHDC